LKGGEDKQHTTLEEEFQG